MADVAEVSFANLQTRFPRLADKYVEIISELDLMPDDIPGVVKDDLPGFFAVVDVNRKVVYLGATMSDTVDGINYVQSHMVFIKYNGELTKH